MNLDQLEKDREWSFVETFYPDYDHCNTIAYANDLEKLINNEYEMGDDAHHLLQAHYDNNPKHPGIEREYMRVHHDIYLKAIENFLEKYDKGDFILRMSRLYEIRKKLSGI